MSAKRTTWQEKLENSHGLPKVCPIAPAQTKRWGAGTMLIPAPLEVDALMRCVPQGRLTTIDELRAALARRHGATITCPLTTGIFAWIAAHAAADAQAQHQKNTTPFWRTHKARGELNPKYPGGIPGQKKHLRAEGHTIIKKGQRFFVKDYAAALANLDPSP